MLHLQIPKVWIFIRWVCVRFHVVDLAFMRDPVLRVNV